MKRIFGTLTLLLLIGLYCAPHNSIIRAEDWKDYKKAFEEAQDEGSRSRMVRAAKNLGNTNEAKAADFLLDLLEDDQKARKRDKAGLPGEVRDAVTEALGKFTNADAVEKIGKAALKLDSSPKKNPVLALDQFDFFKALAGMKDVKAADETIRKALSDNKNPYVKCAALEAIRQVGASRFVDDVVGILLEDNDAWAKDWIIVPINVFACLRDIADGNNLDQVVKIVEAVITWEERKLCTHERVRYFGGMMLAELTGETASMEFIAFWKWWVAQVKALGEKPADADAPKRNRSKTAATPPVFDSAPVGRRFVFVIDLSSSMEKPLKIDLDEIEKRKKKRKGPTTGKKKIGGDDPDADGEDKEPENPLARLPWKDIETKWDLAREELARSIADFAGDRYFAIITYSNEHENITGGWVQATKANCRKWSDKVQDLELQHMTNIHGGLMHALRISDKGDDAEHPSVDPDCVMSGADTIVFLTDGWGSWDDFSDGKVKDKRNGVDNSVGDGPFIYGENIWPDILRVNIFRKVVINTVGIGNHDVNLLKNLAKKTGGTYVDWSFPE